MTHSRQEYTIIPTLLGEKCCLLLLRPCTPKKEFQREMLCCTAELVLPSSSCINSTTTTVPPLFQKASLIIRIGMMQNNLTHLWGSHDYVHYNPVEGKNRHSQSTQNDSQSDVVLPLYCTIINCNRYKTARNR